MAGVNHFIVLLFLGLGLTAAFEISNVGWWKNTPFYQIYPRSFRDSDGDGIGDLNGITSKLEHFVDAGIGAIWLSPIYASPMVDFGYDISNFKEIHEEYGTMEDFEALVKRAKELKLKLILDLVPNHASDDHEWFKKSEEGVEAYKDYFIWHNGSSSTVPPNNWISVFSGLAWTFSEKRKQWYFHQFHKRQPDLNYNSPAVKREMAGVIQFWLDKGVDGFRIDAVPHLYEVDDLKDEPKTNITGATATDYTYLDHIYTKDQPKTYELVKSWRTILDTYASIDGSDERVMMTEAYTSLENTTKFYDAGAHVPFNFKFITDVDKDSKPNDFKNVIDSWMTEANKKNGTPNWVMGNHDRSRIDSRYPGRGDQMTMLAMILPGVSVTYYGEEIGMVDNDDITFNQTVDPQGCLAGELNYKKRSRDPCRTPFQWDAKENAGFSSNESTWLPINKNFNTINLETEKAAEKSHYHIYRNLTTLKKSSLAIINGTLKTIVTNNNQVLTIVRTYNVGAIAKETVLLVINFSENVSQIVDLTSHIANNVAPKGVIAVATLNSQLQLGQSVDLSKLNIAGKTSLVIIANQNKTPTTNQVPNSSGKINRISFIIFIGLIFISFK